MKVDRYVRRYKCQVGDDGIHALVSVLGQTNRSVCQLDLGRNRFGSDIIPGIAYALSANVLTTLCLRGNDLRPADAAILADSLCENTSLKVLDLRNNKIADSGCVHMAKLLRNNSDLVSLDMRDNVITQQGFKELYQALCNNTTLQVLFLEVRHGVCLFVTPFS